MWQASSFFPSSTTKAAQSQALALPGSVPMLDFTMIGQRSLDPAQYPVVSRMCLCRLPVKSTSAQRCPACSRGCYCRGLAYAHMQSQSSRLEKPTSLSRYVDARVSKLPESARSRLQSSRPNQDSDPSSDRGTPSPTHRSDHVAASAGVAGGVGAGSEGSMRGSGSGGGSSRDTVAPVVIKAPPMLALSQGMVENLTAPHRPTGVRG